MLALKKREKAAKLRRMSHLQNTAYVSKKRLVFSFTISRVAQNNSATTEEEEAGRIVAGPGRRFYANLSQVWFCPKFSLCISQGESSKMFTIS